MQKAKSGSRGKKLGLNAKWQKIKIDWQIAAIAKVCNAEVLYTTDSDLTTIAHVLEIKTAHVADLELPPSDTPLLESLDD